VGAPSALAPAPAPPAPTALPHASPESTNAPLRAGHLGSR